MGEAMANEMMMDSMDDGDDGGGAEVERGGAVHVPCGCVDVWMCEAESSTRPAHKRALHTA